jgi:hypothetical protein
LKSPAVLLLVAIVGAVVLAKSKLKFRPEAISHKL